MNYRLIGNTVPAVEVTLQSGEEIYTQSGGMVWNNGRLEMVTDTKGGIMKGIGRMFAGEKFFMNTYRANQNDALIAFAATAPGVIVPLEFKGNHPGIIAQKEAFLCAELGVKTEVTLTKKFGAGLFGGEGFVLQDISGEGMAFLEVDGDIMEKELQAGETILVDTGNVVYFEKTCKYEIETVKGVKNILFGGEGLFLTKLTGPGKIVLQTQNIHEFANRIIPFLPKTPSN